jgi:hypothetical protein
MRRQLLGQRLAMMPRRLTPGRVAPALVVAMLLGCGSGGQVSYAVPRGADGGAAVPGRTPDAREPLPIPEVDTIFEDGCATATARAELLASNVLFVVDRSSSMICNPPPTTSSVVCEQDSLRADPAAPSKWEIVRSALKNAIATLPSATLAGLSYFSNDDSCGVHSLPSVAIAELTPVQRSAIDVSLANVKPSGATPLVGATILAYHHLHGAALEGRLRGNKFVVLLTDGEQSEMCSDTARCNGAQQCTALIESEVRKAAGPGVGIKTFVIGAPGSEPARRVLSQMAELGGTAPANCSVEQGTCHFDMTRRPEFGVALSEALASIAGRTLSCELPIPAAGSVEVDPRRLNVVYSPGDGRAPQVVLKDDRMPCDAGASGWQYSEDASRIRLCGSACDRVRQDAGARVDVVLGCQVRVPE